MKKKKLITLFLVIGGIFLLGSPLLSEKVLAKSVSIQTVYRLYNKYTGEHFYTTSLTEKNATQKAGWNSEGTGWYAPSYSNSPVYRVYNPHARGGDHYYTKSLYEASSLVSKGWRWDNNQKPVFYSATANQKQVYVDYNPNAQSGAHNYTSNYAEHLNLEFSGWKFPSTAWYGTFGNYNWNEAAKTYQHEIANIHLTSISRTKDAQGEDALQINFDIRNQETSSEMVLLLWLESFEVNQVGANTSNPLYLANLYDGSDGNLYNNLQAGQSVSATVLFKLENTNDPVNITVMENFNPVTYFTVYP